MSSAVGDEAALRRRKAQQGRVFGARNAELAFGLRVAGSDFKSQGF